MKYNAKILQSKIKQYHANYISQAELGNWAELVYLDLLKGGFVYLDKLEIYPFIKEISTFHRIRNEYADFFPCTLNRVKEIESILMENKDYTFSIAIKLPAAFCDNLLNNFDFLETAELLKKIQKYFFDITPAYIGDDVDLEEGNLIITFINKSSDCNTVFGLIENKIRILLKCIYAYDEKDIIYYRNKISLFNQSDLLVEKRLLQYIGFYLGEQPFLISHSKTNPNLWDIF